MNERGANIDVVFRNGLKDYEVLPPQEVWDNMQPVIRRKLKPFVLIRSAALIAVVLSLSFLTYRWSREITTGLDTTVISSNEEAISPENNNIRITSIPLAAKENNLIEDSSDKIVADVSDSVEKEDYINSSLPVVPLLKESSLFSSDNTILLKGPKKVELKTIENSISDAEITYDPFIPVTDKEKMNNRWSITALASPTYYSKFNSGSDELSQQLKTSEQPLISYSGGVAFAYKINKRFSIQSGLFYSSVEQEVGGISSFGGFQPYGNAKGNHNFEVITSNGIVYTNNADVFLFTPGSDNRIVTNFTNDIFDPKKASLQKINDNLQQNFSYLELPLFLRYKFIDKTLDFNLIGGLSYNMLVNNSVFTMSEGGKYPIGTTDGLNMVTLSSSLGMGMEYNFSDKFSLNLEPTFRYYLNPFNHLISSGTHPYSFGIFSGISYKF